MSPSQSDQNAPTPESLEWVMPWRDAEILRTKIIEDSTTMTDEEMAAIGRRLAAPFNPEDIHWKPQAIRNNSALAVAFIDARDVMDRLDAVVGVGNWYDRYDILSDGNVLCSLTVTIGGKEVTKIDVGSPSEQPDGGDRMKASISDALKRAGVKFGIGRSLYRLPLQWCDYDAQKKRFTQQPQLPKWYFAGAEPPKQQPEQHPRQDAEPSKPPAAPAKPAVIGPADGSPKVTAVEVGKMEKLVTVAKADPTRFLAAYGVGLLSEMRMNQYEDAVAKLKAKIDAMTKQAAQTPSTSAN